MGERTKSVLIATSTAIGLFASVVQVVDFVLEGKLNPLLVSLGLIFAGPPIVVLVLLAIHSKGTITWNFFRTTALTCSVVASLSIVVLVFVLVVQSTSQRTRPNATPVSPTIGGQPAIAVAPPTNAPGSEPQPNCPPPGRTQASVVDLRESSRYGITAGPAEYTAQLTSHGMTLEASGQVRGRLPAGKKIVALRWADKSSVDSLGQRGDGLYRPLDTLTYSLTTGCWHLPLRESGYAGLKGLTYRIYLGVLDEPRADEILRAKTLNDADLRSNGLSTTEYFEVPTGSL